MAVLPFTVKYDPTSHPASHKPRIEIRNEVERLATFKKWPSSAQMSPTRLAKIGFYYQDHLAELVCFSCGGRIDCHLGDPEKVHRDAFPMCPLVRGKEKGNVPMVPLRDAISSSPSSNHSNGVVDKTTYEGRLSTYTHWPINNPMSPLELARVGFSHTGSQDVVECFACKGRIRHWEPTDTVLGEHRRHFPNCPFLNNFDQEERSSSYVSQTRSQRRPAENNMPFLPEDENPIVTEIPKTPQYAIESKRLESFTNWPTTKDQKPDELAGAGFFYAGFNDNVKCFFCGGGLRNWDPDDKPWEEHARWFPKCGWVKQCMGLAYIKKYANKKKTSCVKKITSVGSNPNTLEAMMESPAVQAVEEIGYDSKIIRKTIKKVFLHKNDASAFNAENLMDAIYEIEEEIKRNPMTSSEEISENEAAGQTTETLPTESEALKKENSALRTRKICKICFKRDSNVLLLPCAHLVSCDECSNDLQICPTCSSHVKGTVKTFLA